MDQLLRRTRMAERQVARRLKKFRELRYGGEVKVERKKVRVKLLAEIVENQRAAVRARQEDWHLGPLAPRRDVPKLPGLETRPQGFKFEIKEKAPWGSISTSRARLDWYPSPAERDKVAAWAGGMRYLCLAVGDRVAIQEGPLKGQIGAITKINRQVAGVMLKDIGKVNVSRPLNPQMPEASERVASMSTTLPISAVRLVHPMTRDSDGVTRDVVIRELRPQRIRHDGVTRRTVFERMVPGPRVCIPWPAVSPRPREDQPGDTPRSDVEVRTFVPTLGQPPMPASVLDELRNRYSRFRTRHDDDYVARRVAEQADRDARRRSGDQMRTPLQEFNAREREARRARGQPVLTDEMLTKVGEVILAARRERGDMGHLQKAVEQLSLQSHGPEASADRPGAS